MFDMLQQPASNLSPFTRFKKGGGWVSRPENLAVDVSTPELHGRSKGPSARGSSGVMTLSLAGNIEPPLRLFI